MSSYDDLTLDHIYLISKADNEHAPEIDEQVAAARELGDHIENSLGQLRDALSALDASDFEGIGKVFEGTAAEAALDRLGKLTTNAHKGRKAMTDQPAAFESIATGVRNTHRHINTLRDERGRWLDVLATDPANPELKEKFGGFWTGDDPESIKTAIVDKYDRYAREQMQVSADGYLAEAGRLPSTETYQGPRQARPGEGGSADGGGSGGTGSGPGGNGPRNSPGPTLQSGPVPGAPSFAPASPVPGGGAPVLQSGPAPFLGPVAFPGANRGSAPVPRVPGSVGLPGQLFVPNRPVTPPVIGARGAGAFGTSRTPGPNPSGLNRPVIGSRPGAAPRTLGAVSRSSGAPRPVVRPGTAGQRAVPRLSAPGRNAPTGRVGRFATNPGTGEPRPGIRSVPPAEHSSGGKVIRQPSKPTVSRPEFSRAPRPVRTNPDSLNRPVIRNSRALTGPAPTETIAAPAPPPTDPADEAESMWFDGSHAVDPVIRGTRGDTGPTDHDPGRFLTRYNLGRHRLD